MLQWFRARGRSLAATALLSLSVMGGLSSAPHPSDCHDSECAVRVVAHDASAHVFQRAAPVADAHPLHCVLCHLTRTFRPNTNSTIQAPSVDRRDVRTSVTVVSVARVFPAAQPPLRSPPVSPALAVLA